MTDKWLGTYYSFKVLDKMFYDDSFFNKCKILYIFKLVIYKGLIK